MTIINDSDRIQFERGIMEYALQVDEAPRDFFLTIAAAKLNKYIRKHNCLPNSLLKFCNEAKQEAREKGYLNDPRKTLR